MKQCENSVGEVEVCAGQGVGPLRDKRSSLAHRTGYRVNMALYSGHIDGEAECSGDVNGTFLPYRARQQPVDPCRPSVSEP